MGRTRAIRYTGIKANVMSKTLKKFSPMLPNTGYVIQYDSEWNYREPANLLLLNDMIRVLYGNLWVRIV